MADHTHTSTPPHERNVKDDLSEIKNSLAHKWRRVASLLDRPSDTESDHMRRKIEGIKNDFAEIKGKVKAGMSLLFERAPEEEEYQPKRPVGVTNEVLSFVTDLVTHKRAWKKFPLPKDAKPDEFALNESQQSHARAVEREVPKLEELRYEMCPDYMSEGKFWMVYFVMVHPKLDKNDALALSSHQIAKARALLTLKSKHQEKDKQTEGMNDVSSGSSTTDSTPEIASAPNKASLEAKDLEHLKVDFDGSSEVILDKVEEGNDEWLNERTPGRDGITGKDLPVSYNEDVSFSDLEEDDVKETEGSK